MCLKESWEILSRAAVFKNVRERSMDEKYYTFSLLSVVFFFLTTWKSKISSVTTLSRFCEVVKYEVFCGATLFFNTFIINV